MHVDNTPYISGASLEKIITSLNNRSEKIFMWFNKYYMKVYQLLSHGENINANITNTVDKK